VQLVADELHAEEGPGIHGSAPYRARTEASCEVCHHDVAECGPW